MYTLYVYIFANCLFAKSVLYVVQVQGIEDTTMKNVVRSLDGETCFDVEELSALFTVYKVSGITWSCPFTPAGMPDILYF